MKLSAEIRWFGPGDAPTDLDRWFCSGAPFPYPPGGTLIRKRSDDYVRHLT